MCSLAPNRAHVYSDLADMNAELESSMPLDMTGVAFPTARVSIAHISAIHSYWMAAS